LGNLGFPKPFLIGGNVVFSPAHGVRFALTSLSSLGKVTQKLFFFHRKGELQRLPRNRGIGKPRFSPKS